MQPVLDREILEVAEPGIDLDQRLVRRVEADARFLGIRSRTRVTRRVIEASPRLVAVGCFCIGTDQVDLAAASDHGVAVFNAPFSNTRSVAELVVAEAILLLRGVPARNAGCHRGAWLKSARDAHESRGKTLGIVGYGAIGSQVSVLAEALGMHVVYHDIEPKLPLGNALALSNLDAVLATSDVVTLHVPDTPETRGLIGTAELARMRPGAVLLNASRGTVVDLDALADALRGGHLAGAAVDVFPAEPRSPGDEFTSPLRGLDNALLTPHIGGSTVEAQANIGGEVARKLVMYSDNGTTTASVNCRAWLSPFWPVVAASTNSTSTTEPSPLSATRRTLDSSSIRLDFVCNRPAVSRMRTSTSFSRAALSAFWQTLTATPTALPYSLHLSGSA